jgi:choline dehydrogenase-like flavoprotein
MTSDRPTWVATPRDGILHADIVVIGTGMGGSAAAWALRHASADVLLLERGGFLPREDENWSAAEVFMTNRYKNAEDWYETASGAPFKPGVHYYVGGNTKVYGASLPRFREQDFAELRHAEGVSPAWAFSYDDIEPFYTIAEQMLDVHGTTGEDPTEPRRSTAYPRPALEHEPQVQTLADSMRNAGLHPFRMPMGVDYGPAGTCIRCATCDGFPCKLGAKNDGETRGVRPALDAGSVKLLTHAKVTKLLTDSSGRTVTSALVDTPDGPISVTASHFLLAAGAVNSTVLMLQSANTHHPNGLANSSDQLGRNYMVHNSTFLVGLDPRRRNQVQFQKTLGLNDWYLDSPAGDFPLGNIQMLGKLQGAMIKPARPHIPQSLLDLASRHSIDMYLTTEDLPTQDNRVTVDTAGRISVRWNPINLGPHKILLKYSKRLLHDAGYPIAISERMGIETNSHMCGTARTGDDPGQFVLDPNGKAHDLTNLWLVDSSGFNSSAALNPALTIAANALRVVAQAGLAPNQPSVSSWQVAASP